MIEIALTDKQRKVVGMYYNEGKTVSEIAVSLGLSDSGVYKMLKRAIKKLEKSKEYF